MWGVVSGSEGFSEMCCISISIWWAKDSQAVYSPHLLTTPYAVLPTLLPTLPQDGGAPGVVDAVPAVCR
jgi:hypothetical protein